MYVIYDSGDANGHCFAQVLTEYWWCIWWDNAFRDSRVLYTVALDDSSYLFVKVVKVYGKLCHASNTVHLLLLYEAISCSKVILATPYFNNLTIGNWNLISVFLARLIEVKVLRISFPLNFLMSDWHETSRPIRNGGFS